MIRQDCFTKAWIQQVSTNLHYPDANLIEKVIRAFSLVEMLSDSGCPYIWKGGTALMILLGGSRHMLVEEENDILSTNNKILNLIELLRKTPAEKAMENQFQSTHKDGEDPTITTMMSFYMLAALEELMPLTKDRVKAIALDIATAGISGIDPQKKSGYFVPTLPGRDFGGYQFLAYYYVSWAIAIPEMLPKLNLPFDTAYNAALSLYAAKKGKQNN